MSSVERFEDLIAWQKARVLARLVYEVTKREPLARDYRLSGQLQGAAVSVMSNIAEGFAREGPAKFLQFLKVAKGSCGETRSLRYVALDTGYIDQSTFVHLRDRTDEVDRILNGLRNAIARRRTSRLPTSAPTPILGTEH